MKGSTMNIIQKIKSFISIMIVLVSTGCQMEEVDHAAILLSPTNPTFVNEEASFLSSIFPGNETLPGIDEIEIEVGETVLDIDSNVYHTVKIGNQTWMMENLKVTRYRNGDPIPNVKSNIEWNKTNSGAYCNYDNDKKLATTYGRLYNWYCINDKRGLAPFGWRIPDDNDWQELVDYLGGDSIAGGKLKAIGTSIWKSPNSGATNESNFFALPAGYRNYYGSFSDLGFIGSWWSAPNRFSKDAWYRTVSYYDQKILRSHVNERLGFSARCIKDK